MIGLVAGQMGAPSYPLTNQQTNLLRKWGWGRKDNYNKTYEESFSNMDAIIYNKKKVQNLYL